MKPLGKKRWILPDCELPPEGEGELKGHESVIIVNDGKKDAEISVKILYADRPEKNGAVWRVGAGRVRCFRTNSIEDMGGIKIKENEQYALCLASDTPVVVQYGRLDNRQANLAFYTTLGYSE